MAANILHFCPGILYSNECTAEDCRLAHDVKLCEPCGYICAPARAYTAHCSGTQHKRNAATNAETFPFCVMCERDTGRLDCWQIHIAGHRHRKLAAALRISPIFPPPDAATLGRYAKRCAVCDVVVLNTRWQVHLGTIAHARRQAVATHKAAFEAAERDREGITVSCAEGLDFGIIKPEDARRGVHRTLVIHSTSAMDTSVENVAVFDDTNRPSKSFEAEIAGDSRLDYGQNVQLRVTLRQTNFGRTAGHIEIVFRKSSRRFAIVRTTRAVVGDGADHELLKAATPYVQRKRVPWKGGQRYYPGRRPPALDAVPWVRRLRTYEMPAELANVLSGESAEIVQTTRDKHLPKSFDAFTHGDHFKVLLWVEEFRQETDLRRYDLAEASFSNEGRLHFLVVPGLAEKRPSVVVGDRIEVQPSGTTIGRCFEGWVHVVRRDDVGVDFHSSFKADGRQRFNVRFKLNRIPLRRQHQALRVSLPSLQRILFPDRSYIGLAETPSVDFVIKPFNRSVERNTAQLQAIRSILQLRSGAAPFIVFGPPGTGKTVTVIEAIRQILSRNPHARILACAPSNSAADILAQRLIDLGTNKLFRYYAVSRDQALVPGELLQYTHINSQGFFSVPAVDELAKFAVVVSTCGSSSFAYGVGVPSSHFTHIFVDEAGQATEPEVMAAIKTMTTPTTHLVLSGDPKQLGPIIRSGAARELGLGISYLERLMESDLYGPDMRGKTFVKLVQNFRSHGTILNFPNQQFYADELEVRGPKAVINSYVGWRWLVSPKFPVVFHAISGQDEREASSPSYFNIDEITAVKDYIQKLKEDGDYPIPDEEIGIISPYRAQCRKAISKIASDIKVASVEEYQGQERRVIVLSTVRSTRDLLEYDMRYTLGFVANPRRFNVAITRAKALLIIVGNPTVLSTDPLWRRFLNYVYLNGGWRGEPITWNPNDPVQDDAQYAQQLQEQGAAHIAAFMQRMQAYHSQEREDITADELESAANTDTVFVEPE